MKFGFLKLQEAMVCIFYLSLQMKTFSFHNHRTFQIIRAYLLSLLLLGKSCRKVPQIGGLWRRIVVKVRGPGELPSHFGWNSVDRLIDTNLGIEGITCINSFSPMVSQNWIISRKQMTNLFLSDEGSNTQSSSSNFQLSYGWA